MSSSLHCSSCKRDMALQLRVPSMRKPGSFNYLFACQCGNVDRQVRQEREEPVAIDPLSKGFVIWATRSKTPTVRGPHSAGT